MEMHAFADILVIVKSMTIKIDLKPEVQAGLAAQAKARGVPLDTYVQSLLEQMTAPMQPPEIVMTAEQRALAFRRWAEGFPYRRTSPLPDEAIRRDSFYSAE